MRIVWMLGNLFVSSVENLAIFLEQTVQTRLEFIYEFFHGGVFGYADGFTLCSMLKSLLRNKRHRGKLLRIHAFNQTKKKIKSFSF
jgi:hypothetical protein